LSRTVRIDGYRCTASAGLLDALGPAGSLEEEVARIRDRATRIHGVPGDPIRNEMVQLGVGGSPVEAIVKTFPAGSWRAGLDRAFRGSTRAERSWHAAEALVRHGIATPEPLLLMTPEGPTAGRPSFYVARYLSGAIEIRRLTDKLRWNQTDAELAPLDVGRILRAVGRLARALHRAGIWHRDLTAGNLILWPWPGPEPELYLIDLDRARVDRAITPAVRIRELGRFPLFQDEHRRLLLEGYYAPEPVPRFEAALYHLHVRAFHRRTRLRLKIRKYLAQRPRNPGRAP